MLLVFGYTVTRLMDILDGSSNPVSASWFDNSLSGLVGVAAGGVVAAVTRRKVARQRAKDQAAQIISKHAAKLDEISVALVGRAPTPLDPCPPLGLVRVVGALGTDLQCVRRDVSGLKVKVDTVEETLTKNGNTGQNTVIDRLGRIETAANNNGVGPQGETGSTGDSGVQGPPGPAGEAGRDGRDGRS